MTKIDYIASPLNYIGGKKKLLSQIIPIFPQNISTFVDLFCGGCNVGINVDAKKICFNDNLVYLIDMYKSFQLHTPEEVISFVENRISTLDLSLTNTEGYLALRKEYNSMRNPLDLFVLIAFSFNHQIRFNSAHEYNNPFGKNRSCYNARMRNNLIRFLDKIQTKEIIFKSENFIDFDFQLLSSNDFVYADPPYLITTGTYNDGKRVFSGWSDKEELALLNILETLDRKGIKFGLSNVTEHKGRENLILKDWIAKHDFTVHELSMNYKNSNYQTSGCDKGKTVEVLVTNFKE